MENTFERRINHTEKCSQAICKYKSNNVQFVFKIHIINEIPELHYFLPSSIFKDHLYLIKSFQTILKHDYKPVFVM